MKKINFKNLIALFSLVVILQVNAQPQRLVADYPLIENLEDMTGINNNVYLEGNPDFPILPSSENSLCSNGIYIVDENGQNIETPIMPFFDVTNFSIEVEFNVTELPLSTALRTRMPIIMGSRFARWLGIYINSDGVMGFKYNNDSTNYVWSNTAISNIDDWYSTKISYVDGQVELYLDDQLILSDDLPDLNTFMNTFNFSVTDFSEGNPFNGCIRNLKILTDVQIYKSSFE